MIRGNLGVDPERMDENEWAYYYAQALWLEQWRFKNLAKVVIGVFGKEM